jgi:transcriptional regulator with PAS, ATPase and Fis domain
MIHASYNKLDMMSSSGLDPANLQAISQYKDFFIKNNRDPGAFSILEPEVVTSWKRSKSYKIDPDMDEMSDILKSHEIKALLHDKDKFINLAKSYFYVLLPLLYLPKTTIVIQDENGTFLDLSDHDRLLTLKPTKGSIWREDTVGTSSTSLCLEYGKIVQLAGSRHYCKALENQLATTTPIYDASGSRLGLVTIVNDITEVLWNEEKLQRVLSWICVYRMMLETKLELAKRSFSLIDNVLHNESPFSTVENKAEQIHPEGHLMKECFFSNVLGESPEIKKVLRIAERFSQSDSSILLSGESGTGKELFAQAIHRASGRSGPFVAINCAAFPANLIASELFGYVGGAFTGAENKGRTGKIELAKDGTLFLDEIGDMPLEIQPTFLRVLEDKKVTRLGSNKEIQVDFRLIAATNADLFQLVQEKKFRADLYYRLETLQLNLPPLRERGDDILLIANDYLDEIFSKTGRRYSLDKHTEQFLLNYIWPGNIRQLQNAMLYATNVCGGQVITPQDLPVSVYRSLEAPLPNEEFANYPLLTIQEMEQKSIRRALLLTGNNVRAAARMLGLSKTSIYRKLKEYNIEISHSETR